MYGSFFLFVLEAISVREISQRDCNRWTMNKVCGLIIYDFSQEKA